jgi:ABC-type transport system involved in cytochrome c biogenesis permease subunit
VKPVNNPLVKKIIAPIASLRLTVVLLSLAMLVILAGTTAQEHMGIWQVQEKYFHSWACKIDLDLLFPLVQTHIPGAIPMLGGYSLIALLLVNLVSAHALRFKVSPWDIVLLPALGFLLAILWAWQNNQAVWLLALSIVVAVGFTAGVFAVHKKRGGVILIHLGLILLLVGELLTSVIAVESRMTIDEGESASYSYDLREPELVLADASSPHQDTVYAIDNSNLSAGSIVADAKLPGGIQVRVDRFYPNSALMRAEAPSAADAPPVTKPVVLDGVKVAAVPQARFTGAGEDASQVDTPSAYITLLNKSGQAIGTYLASTRLDATRIDVEGKPFDLSLRFRRYYVPFRLELKDFRFDRYVGTNTPKNYSAHVRLVDPQRNEDREVTISMNNPLRHAGLTFYQASFDDRTEKTTHLQVVRNPGWLVPYVSCLVGTVGLVSHFGIVLVNFLRKRKAAAAAAAAEAAAAPAEKGRKKDRGGAPGTTYTLEPRRDWAAIGLSSVVGVLAVVYLISAVTRTSKETKPFDLAGFGQIPISFGGRQQPLDSIARNHLKVISGKEEWTDNSGEKQPAIKWLLDVFTRRAGNHKVFRIDHPGIKALLAPHIQVANGEKPVAERRLFAPYEMGGAFPELNRQIGLAEKVASRDRDLFQRKVVELSRQIASVGQLQSVPGLFVVPPSGESQEWRTVGEALEDAKDNPAALNPLVGSLLTMFDAYGRNDPVTFNAEVKNYRTLITQAVPKVVAKTDFETRFNLASPFIVCIYLYVGVFLLAVFSWLGWREPLRRSAFVLLAITVVFHTLALVGRIYISGRPPVTNLYSSAVFIAWGMALLALFLEMVYRNGIGCVVAAVTAFPSLLIAHYLSFSGSGDTMEVLQAVLDTNFWLATHVVTITLGYSATFLAGFLGIAYIVLGIFTPTLRDEKNRKAIARMTYGTLCFAILLSFVGTVLGGIWADQSWGRFWGWDPKENGAVLIVLWNAVILHARWGGIVRERGLAVLAIFGNVVTAWSWFGTNMLGVGLHSYGFMDSAVFWLAFFVFSQLFLMLLGNVPLRYWWSLKPTGPQGRGFEPRVMRSEPVASA